MRPILCRHLADRRRRASPGSTPADPMRQRRLFTITAVTARGRGTAASITTHCDVWCGTPADRRGTFDSVPMQCVYPAAPTEASAAAARGGGSAAVRVARYGRLAAQRAVQRSGSAAAASGRQRQRSGGGSAGGRWRAAGGGARGRRQRRRACSGGRSALHDDHGARSAGVAASRRIDVAPARALLVLRAVREDRDT